MNEREMLRELCSGHSCNKCRVKELGIDCVAVDQGKGSSDDIFAIEQLYYELHPEERPVVISISADDMMSMFNA